MQGCPFGSAWARLARLQRRQAGWKTPIDAQLAWTGLIGVRAPASFAWF
jgi:hypothetical protein